MKIQQANFSGIQLLRGAAAVAVLIHHTLEESTILLPGKFIPDFLILIGASGVDIFFVISGFIMFYTMQNRFNAPTAASDFMARRLIRIIPLYWMCTLLILMLASSGLAYKSLIVTPDNIISAFFLLPNDWPILGVAWTLQYEMYFYVLFAWCLTFLSTHKTVIILPLVLFAVTCFGQLLPASPARDFFTNPIALEFSFGLWLAYFFCSEDLPRISTLAAVLTGLMLIIAATLLFPGNGTTGLERSMRFFTWGIPATLIVYAVLFMGKIGGPIGRVLYLVGDASYSIYLTHAIVMTGYARLIKSDGVALMLPPGLWILSAIGLAMIVGLATYQLVECPTNVWLRQRWIQRSTRITPSSA